MVDGELQLSNGLWALLNIQPVYAYFLEDAVDGLQEGLSGNNSGIYPALSRSA